MGIVFFIFLMALFSIPHFIFYYNSTGYHIFIRALFFRHKKILVTHPNGVYPNFVAIQDGLGNTWKDPLSSNKSLVRLSADGGCTYAKNNRYESGNVTDAKWKQI